MKGQLPGTAYLKEQVGGHGAIQMNMYLRIRSSTSCLAISANRLAKRPPRQQTKGAPLRGAHPLFLPGVVLLSDLR